MTRFARAKGSKASNERAPEESTPWEVMKGQLVQAKIDSEEASKRKEAEKQRIENYEKFLNDQKVQKRKATWCDFPEEESNNNKFSDKGESPSKKKKRNKQKQQHNITQSEAVNEISNAKDISIETPNKKSKKKKLKKQNCDNVLPIAQQPQSETALSQSTMKTSTDGSEISKKKKKNKENKKNPEQVSQTDASSIHDQQISPFNKKTKNKKNKNVRNFLEEEKPVSHENEPNINVDENITLKNNNKKQKKNKKDKKFMNGEPERRKPINDRSFQLIINSKEVELVRFDGFPIMKRDAERLEELKHNMIQNGIPKSEVQRTLKLERRRAEKALARLKRDVCYNCRKGGHNLSDCPELKTKIPGVGAADGVCFKCGSTEHRQFECKVQKDKEFRFATCFICKEPGHIARQCPDNPKGLYPNGGNCKLCGDVTHLRKDCPTVTDKKETTSIKLQTLDSAENIEGIEYQMKNAFTEEKTKKPKKIKF